MIVRLSGGWAPEPFIFLSDGLNLYMISVGEILRSARESQGRTMAEIAEELCITQRYLRALECDDLSNLPGTFFYKSFVKQYAAILGVPVKKLQLGIDAIAGSETERPPANLTGAERSSPAPIRVLDPLVEASNRYFSNRKIGVPMAALALVLLACSGFYGWWTQPPGRTRASRTSPSAPTRTVASSPPGSQASTVDVTTTPDGINHVVLNLSATESTWLSITSEGKQIYSALLQPGQTKTLTAADAARMLVGNAGGIAVRMNGKEIGPLGGRGQVRTVLFTAPDKFEIVEPVAPAPPDDAAL
jgi:cytoskeleton protein RodZ